MTHRLVRAQAMRPHHPRPRTASHSDPGPPNPPSLADGNHGLGGRKSPSTLVGVCAGRRWCGASRSTWNPGPRRPSPSGSSASLPPLRSGPAVPESSSVGMGVVPRGTRAVSAAAARSTPSESDRSPHRRASRGIGGLESCRVRESPRHGRLSASVLPGGRVEYQVTTSVTTSDPGFLQIAWIVHLPVPSTGHGSGTGALSYCTSSMSRPASWSMPAVVPPRSPP